MKRRFVRYVLMAALPIAAACGGDSPTQPTAASVSGTYALKSINGVSLPYIVSQSGADKTEITSDVITASNGSFTELGTYRVTQSGQVTTQTVSDAGTYAVNGTAVTFTFQSDGTTGTGTISGNSYTIAMNGVSSVYVKQ